MILHHIIQCIFLATGITSLSAAIFNWEWFFSSDNAMPIVKYMGRTKSRLLYAIIGIVLILLSVGFYYYVKSTI